MIAHVWLGIACFPVVLLHSGFRLGGPLACLLLLLFVGVIASGVWGLLMQQWLPQKILAEFPGETVASQVDFTGDFHAREAARLVHGLTDEATGDPEPVVVGRPAEELCRFLDLSLVPYLREGRRSGSPLAGRAEVGAGSPGCEGS